MLPLLLCYVFSQAPPDAPAKGDMVEEKVIKNIHGFDVEVIHGGRGVPLRLMRPVQGGVIVDFVARPDGTGAYDLVQRRITLPPSPPPAGVGIELPDGRFVIDPKAETVQKALKHLREPAGGVSMSELKKKAEGDGPEAAAAREEYERLISGELSNETGMDGPTVGKTIRLDWGDPNLPPDLRAAVPGQMFGSVMRPRLPSDPLVGTLKLTGPDGTVTEYQAEFIPDPPPTPEPPPRFRLGIVIAAPMEPIGDPPGLAVKEALANGPAAKAGIEVGDRLISVAGEPLKSFPQLRDRIAAAAERDEPLRVKVVRPGGDDEESRILEFDIEPETVELPEPPSTPTASGQGNFEEAEPLRFSLGPATVRPAEVVPPRGARSWDDQLDALRKEVAEVREQVRRLREAD